jgi:hypothetical protein
MTSGDNEEPIVEADLDSGGLRTRQLAWRATSFGFLTAFYGLIDLLSWWFLPILAAKFIIAASLVALLGVSRAVFRSEILDRSFLVHFPIYFGLSLVYYVLVAGYLFFFQFQRNRSF